jgi:AcrR family transcriptional regulator
LRQALRRDRGKSSLPTSLPSFEAALLDSPDDTSDQYGTVVALSEQVKSTPKRRRYDATRRQAAALQTRVAIATAARALFLERGYTATTMAAIASAAGVSHETVYATLGPKPAVFRHLIETALSGAEQPIPPLERDYAREVLSEQEPGRLIDIYARAMRLTQQRLASLFDVLNHAATTAPELAQYLSELIERRARYTKMIAEHLAAIGGLRQGVTVQTAADVLFALNSSEFYLLLARDRDWQPDHFERWLADAWKRLILPTARP